MKGIEFFDLKEKAKYPKGPFVTYGGNHGTLYISKEASKKIRAEGYTHVKIGAWQERNRVVLQFDRGSEDGGSLPLAAGTVGKGPGTFQMGGVRPFFKRYGADRGEKRIYPVEWNEEIHAFQFEPDFDLSVQ